MAEDSRPGSSRQLVAEIHDQEGSFVAEGGE